MVPRRRDRVQGIDIRGDGCRRRSWPRKPQVALVDELAHTNVPGFTARQALRRMSPSCSRAGITVISTLNIQHLELRERRRRARSRAPSQQETTRSAIVRRGRSGRARRHGAGGDPPADGARQHLPSRARRHRAGYVLQAPATWRLCESWRCCGSRIESRRASRTTATGTESTAPGRRANDLVAITGSEDGDRPIRRGSAHGGTRARGI